MVNGAYSTTLYGAFGESKLSWSLNPEIGLFANYVLARLRGKLAIQNEIHNYSYNSQIVRTDHNNFQTEYNFKLRYLSMKNIFRYTIYSKSPSIYALLGISNGFVLKNNSYRRILNFGDSEKRTFLDELRNHEEAYILGMGVSIKKVSIETRLIKGNGFSAFRGIGTPTQQVCLSLKYRLK